MTTSISGLTFRSTRLDSQKILAIFPGGVCRRSALDIRRYAIGWTVAAAVGVLVSIFATHSGPTQHVDVGFKICSPCRGGDVALTSPKSTYGGPALHAKATQRIRKTGQRGQPLAAEPLKYFSLGDISPIATTVQSLPCGVLLSNVLEPCFSPRAPPLA